MLEHAPFIHTKLHFSTGLNKLMIIKLIYLSVKSITVDSYILILESKTELCMRKKILIINCWATVYI